MKQQLWTGLWPLMRGEKRQFGTVGAFSPLAQEGMVLLHLRTSDVAIYVERGAINAMIPEVLARELGDKLSLVTTQIAHLRSLHRAGFLSADAMYDDTPIMPDGDQIVDGDDEIFVPAHEDTPLPIGTVSLSLFADHASLLYAAATGEVRISIEEMDAFRSSRAAVNPTAPGQSLVPFISLVQRSRWKRGRDAIERVEELDRKQEQRHHFRFRFPALLVEAIAARIQISLGAELR